MRPDAATDCSNRPLPGHELSAGLAELCHAVHRLGTLMHDANAGAAGLTRKAQEQLSHLEEAAEQSLRAHPRLWLGGALGLVGGVLLAGYLLRHRD